jgi:hypothetical protein
MMQWSQEVVYREIVDKGFSDAEGSPTQLDLRDAIPGEGVLRAG